LQQHPPSPPPQPPQSTTPKCVRNLPEHACRVFGPIASLRSLMATTNDASKLAPLVMALVVEQVERLGVVLGHLRTLGGLLLAVACCKRSGGVCGAIHDL